MKFIQSFLLLVLSNFVNAQEAIISANDSTLCFGEPIVLSSELSIPGNFPILYTVWAVNGSNGVSLSDTTYPGGNFTIDFIPPGDIDVSIINVHEDLSTSIKNEPSFIMIFPVSSADLSSLSNICYGSMGYISADDNFSNNNSYNWYLDGQLSSIHDSVFPYNNLWANYDPNALFEEHELKVSIENMYSCVYESIQNFKIVKPQASFQNVFMDATDGLPPFMCGPVISYLQDNSTSYYPITNWQWYRGDPFSLPYMGMVFSVQQNPDPLEFLYAGDYHLSQVIIDSIGCPDTLSIPYFITIEGPTTTPTITMIPDICGQVFELSLDNSLNVQNWTWELSDGTVYSGNSDTTFNHHFHDISTFPILITVVDSLGCAVNYFDTVIISPNGVNASLSVDHLLFNTGDTALFTDLSSNLVNGIAFRVWDFDDGTTDTLNNETSVSHSYNQPATHIISLEIINDQGCSDMDFVEIQIVASNTESYSYPNPASENIYFSHPGYESIGVIQICDFNGTTILTIPLEQYNQSIDISGLSNGIYYFKFFENTQWNYEEFMVQH